MDRQQLESILCNYKISIGGTRTKKGENASLPNMLVLFRKMLINSIPPTQDNFIEVYKMTTKVTPGILSRLKRAYLSLVREYHLGFLLREHFDHVDYDEDVDIAGVDFIIKYKEKLFNIHAYVGTENGKYWRKVKNLRHNFLGYHIDLPLNLRHGKKCGDFILYSDKDIEGLKRKIEEILQNENSEKDAVL